MAGHISTPLNSMHGLSPPSAADTDTNICSIGKNVTKNKKINKHVAKRAIAMKRSTNRFHLTLTRSHAHLEALLSSLNGILTLVAEEKQKLQEALHDIHKQVDEGED